MTMNTAPPAGAARTMLLLRHGQSTANAEDSFSGWLDVRLTERGESEAARAAHLLAAHGLLPDTAHASVLSRAITTLDIALAVLDRRWIPVRRSWRLNERHYGALQGRDKAVVRAEVGEEWFARWRRSYDTAPPPLDAADPRSARRDPRYAALPAREVPRVNPSRRSGRGSSRTGRALSPPICTRAGCR